MGEWDSWGGGIPYTPIQVEGFHNLNDRQDIITANLKGGEHFDCKILTDGREDIMTTKSVKPVTMTAKFAIAANL